MQQIGGGGYFINVKNTHVCYMKFDFVRILTSVRYWYEICEMPILHRVKFTKCEICGSVSNWY